MVGEVWINQDEQELGYPVAGQGRQTDGQFGGCVGMGMGGRALAWVWVRAIWVVGSSTP